MGGDQHPRERGRRCRVGSKARVWVDAYPRTPLRGSGGVSGHRRATELAEAKLREFFTKIEQRIPVKVVLHNQNDLLKVGMMVWVGIERHRDRRPSQP
jgi:multidrug resistance efflux pump